MALQKFVLPNGVRVLVEPVDFVRSASIGLWCKTGSRNERGHEAGITHLIEHMLFKGTERRTAKEIAEAIEGRGGGLNAFTDKEQTCYYCRVLADDVPNGIDVLTDMMRHSLLAPEEIELEKGVVLEEIKRSEDEPSDLVHDLHLSARWGDHPLGKPVIGTSESVASFGRDDLAAYMDRRYRSGNIVLAVAGNVDVAEVVRLAEAALGDIQPGEEDPLPERPAGIGKETFVEKDVEQVHFCIGTDGVSLYDDALYPMYVLDAAMGGSMSSRLFQEIRERRGLAYSVGSYLLNYSVGGAFTVYGGTSAEKWPTVREVVRSEFDKLMQDGLAEAELEKTKRQLSGNLVLALESMSSRMMRMARNELTHGRDIPIEETLAKVTAVTNAQIIEQARARLAPEQISTTAIIPD